MIKFEYCLTIAIVTYKNDIRELLMTVDSVLKTTLNIHLFIIDNSPTDSFRDLFTDSRIEYIFNGVNVGFGVAHNIAIKHALNRSKYHLVLNPDIYFDNGVLEKIVEFMDSSDVGLLLPKVTNPDGSIRKIRRLLPTPLNVFGKLLPPTSWYQKIELKYRTDFISYETMSSAPFLSGCFMFFRTSELQKIGGFDERFFMYFEDTDLSRRFYMLSSTIYYPKVSIVHLAHRDSRHNFKLFKIHIFSAIRYFNKWGWFFDSERKRVNNNIISSYSGK